MDFKNPISQCGAFNLLSHDELVEYIENLNGTEQYLATIIYGMTMNMCSAHIDGAIKEQSKAHNKDKHWEMMSDARQMHMDMEANCNVTGCTNKATHTWSGHPTCDDCATPSRKGDC